MTERETLDRITENIIGAAIEVHRALRLDLLGGCSSRFEMYYTPRESANEACLAFELAQCGLVVGQQKPLPVVYRGV
ncbi:MAG: GxxExxY protein [Candidatus Bipolaricaulota bacterium]|nr:GxxExxY protein [Candidatus Bipolaricaulota bacterium]